MNFLKIAALSAAVAIALGAFGAHALKESLAANGMTETWKTAVLYHLTHSLALFALALRSGGVGKGPALWSARLWCAGILLFSGSLYGLALGGPSILGPITPLGGLSFIAGWVALVFAKPTR